MSGWTYEMGHSQIQRSVVFGCIDPEVCHGQACITGTRTPVHQILRMLANGDTIAELLTEYPSLTHADILACLDYAAALTEEQVTPLEAFSGEG